MTTGTFIVIILMTSGLVINLLEDDHQTHRGHRGYCCFSCWFDDRPRVADEIKARWDEWRQHPTQRMPNV